MKRTINKCILRQWIKQQGRGGIERLAVDSGCSASLLQKLCSNNYYGIPSLQKIEGICRVTGLRVDELFPIVQEQKLA